MLDQDIPVIAEEYWQIMEKPAEPSATKWILCPVGLVGAGKSTVVKPLAKRFHLARLSGDEIRKILIEKGYSTERTLEIAFAVFLRLAEAGLRIAIDSDCAGSVAQALEEQAKKWGYQIFYIHINPPEEFILNKLRTYKHTWLFKDADDALANYFRRKPLHENLQFPFVYTFDTSRPDLEGQLEEAVKKIETLLNG